MKSITLTTPEVQTLQQTGAVSVWRKMRQQPDHFHRDIIGKPKWSKKDWNRLLPQIGDREIVSPHKLGDLVAVKESLYYSGEHDNWSYTSDRKGVGTEKYIRLSGLLKTTISARTMPDWAVRLHAEVTSVTAEQRDGVWGWSYQMTRKESK